MQHQHIRRQLAGQVLTTCHLLLDELDLVLPDQAARQTQAHLATAPDHHPLHRLVHIVDGPEHLPDVLLRRQHEHLVTRQHHRVTRRLDAHILTVQRHHPHLEVRKILLELRQRASGQGAARHRLHPDQAHPTFGELQHMQGFRIRQQLVDVVRDRILRANDPVHGKPGLRQQLIALPKLGRAQTCNGGRHLEQVVGHLTEHQVGLVRRGAANHHVGILRARIAQHGGLDAIAHDPTQVQALLQHPQALGILIDHRDVVLLGDQAFGDALAHAAGAQNDDVHGPYCAIRKAEMARPAPRSSAFSVAQRCRHRVRRIHTAI